MSSGQRTGRTGWALAAVYWLLPAGAVGGGMVLAPLLGLAGLAGAPDLRELKARQARAWLLACLPLLLFLGWSALSVTWSPVHDTEQAVKNALTCLTGVALIAGVAAGSPRDRARARTTLAVALGLLCVLCAVEALFDLPINRLDKPPGADHGVIQRNPGKGVSILVVLLWGAVGGLAQGGRWSRAGAAVLTLAAAALSTQFNMATNLNSMVLGLVAFVLGWFAPRAGPVLASAIAALWVLAAPWATPVILSQENIVRTMKMSWQMRAKIWGFAHDRIAERPITGWGLDAARTFGENKLHIGAMEFRAIPLHPHSFSIQVWLETGLVGAVLMAAAFAFAGVAGSRTLGASRPAAAALTATIVSVAAIWNVSYGAWQEWWMATAFLAFAGCAAVRR